MSFDENEDKMYNWHLLTCTTMLKTMKYGTAHAVPQPLIGLQP